MQYINYHTVFNQEIKMTEVDRKNLKKSSVIRKVVKLIHTWFSIGEQHCAYSYSDSIEAFQLFCYRIYGTSLNMKNKNEVKETKLQRALRNFNQYIYEINNYELLEEWVNEYNI